VLFGLYAAIIGQNGTSSTPGKSLCGLQVRQRSSGRQAPWGRVFLRTLLLTATGPFLLLRALVAALRGRWRGHEPLLHERWTDTLVCTVLHASGDKSGRVPHA